MGRKRSQSSGSDEPGVPAWMCTWADLSGLLLCFFVLLFSFSTLDNRKIKEVLFSIRSAIGVFDGAAERPFDGMQTETSGSESSDMTRYGLKEAEAKVKRSLGGLGLSSRIGVRKGSEGVIITFQDSMLFGPASSDITPEGIEALQKVNEVLAGFDSEIRVEGHTDDVPVTQNAGSRFKSNWDLSAARALSVLDWLVKDGGFSEKKIHMAGYGSTRPAPGGDNTTFQGRKRNRRVDLVLLAQKKDSESPFGGSKEVIPRPLDANPEEPL